MLGQCLKSIDKTFSLENRASFFGDATQPVNNKLLFGVGANFSITFTLGYRMRRTLLFLSYCLFKVADALFFLPFSIYHIGQDIYVFMLKFIRSIRSKISRYLTVYLCVYQSIASAFFVISQLSGCLHITRLNRRWQLISFQMPFGLGKRLFGERYLICTGIKTRCMKFRAFAFHADA